jgi:hypothetical protein
LTYIAKKLIFLLSGMPHHIISYNHTPPPIASKAFEMKGKRGKKDKRGKKGKKGKKGKRVFSVYGARSKHYAANGCPLYSYPLLRYVNGSHTVVAAIAGKWYSLHSNHDGDFLTVIFGSHHTTKAVAVALLDGQYFNGHVVMICPMWS